jgi:hypothetical protein
MREHGGDVKMPELLSRLVADCPRQRQKAFSLYDRCRAVYLRVREPHRGATVRGGH